MNAGHLSISAHPCVAPCHTPCHVDTSRIGAICLRLRNSMSDADIYYINSKSEGNPRGCSEP
eukprot:3773708-Rhodomonas_salina.1